MKKYCVVNCQIVTWSKWLKQKIKWQWSRSWWIGFFLFWRRWWFWHFLLRILAIGGWFKYAFIKLVRYLIFAPSVGYLINNLCSLLSSSLKYLHKQIMFISFLFAQVHLVFGILNVHRSNGDYCKRSNDKDESLLELKLNSEHNAQCRG